VVQVASIFGAGISSLNPHHFEAVVGWLCGVRGKKMVGTKSSRLTSGRFQITIRSLF